MFWRDAKVIFCTAFVLRLTTWLLLRVWLSFVIWNNLPEAKEIDASFRRLLVCRFDPEHPAISSVNLRNFFFSFASTSFFAPSVKKCKLPKRKKQPTIPPWTVIQRFQDFPRESRKVSLANRLNDLSTTVRDLRNVWEICIVVSDRHKSPLPHDSRTSPRGFVYLAVFSACFSHNQRRTLGDGKRWW